MNYSKEKQRKSKGITLIALVITISVLLILAGVSIAMLTGENGILTQAQTSKEKTDQAEDMEKIKLAVSEAQIGENNYQKLNENNLQKALNNQFGENSTVVLDNDDGTYTVSCLDTLINYKVFSNGVEDEINWNETMEKAVAPASQDEERNNNVIGIGTDGKPVDMDLWEYTVLSDNTIGLNDENSLNDINKNKGYLGDFENGSIVGAIPQYVSVDNGNTYLPVTTMFATFCEISELTTMPKLPTTVKDITNCFIRCPDLTNISSIPTSVEKSVSTFKGCSSLTQAPEIPISIKDIYSMFEGCTNLISGPSIIPNNVEIMSLAFYQCENLQGEIIIEANLSGKMIIEPYQTDFYSSFYDATLSSNNVSLKVYLKDDLYELFTTNLATIINTTSGNSNIEFVQI